MKPAPLPRESARKFKFYVAIHTNGNNNVLLSFFKEINYIILLFNLEINTLIIIGTGGSDGWGSVNDHSRVYISNIAKILDINLTKLSDEMEKS